MAKMDSVFFCILETNPFGFEMFKPNLDNGLHLTSRGQVIIFCGKKYMTSQNWLLLMGGSSNIYCVM